MVVPGLESRIPLSYTSSHAGAINLKLFPKMLKGTKAVLWDLKRISGSGAAVLALNGMLVPRGFPPSRDWGAGQLSAGPCELSQQGNRGTWF